MYGISLNRFSQLNTNFKNIIYRNPGFVPHYHHPLIPIYFLQVPSNRNVSPTGLPFICLEIGNRDFWLFIQLVLYYS